MAEYVAFIASSKGQVVAREALTAADDTAAIARARSLATVTQTIELWEQSRLVARLEAGGTAPPGEEEF